MSRARGSAAEVRLELLDDEVRQAVGLLGSLEFGASVRSGSLRKPA